MRDKQQHNGSDQPEAANNQQLRPGERRLHVHPQPPPQLGEDQEAYELHRTLDEDRGSGGPGGADVGIEDTKPQIDSSDNERRGHDADTKKEEHEGGQESHLDGAPRPKKGCGQRPEFLRSSPMDFNRRTYHSGSSALVRPKRLRELQEPGRRHRLFPCGFLHHLLSRAAGQTCADLHAHREHHESGDEHDDPGQHPADDLGAAEAELLITW